MFNHRVILAGHTLKMSVLLKQVSQIFKCTAASRMSPVVQLNQALFHISHARVSN